MQAFQDENEQLKSLNQELLVEIQSHEEMIQDLTQKIHTQEQANIRMTLYMKDKTDQYDSLQQKMEWQKLQLDEEKLQFGEKKQQLELQIKA